MRRKVYWPIYDADTAFGINNEGETVFDYSREDIDHQPGGADVYNGQSNVMWNNIRDAFGAEIKSMYQTLRSNSTATSGLSYQNIIRMITEHQSKFSEALQNEDFWFKYILPYTENGEDHLGMLQGIKIEHIKWWLYNRFRYLDSKYNAGDAQTDYITMRPYAAASISVTPYADIYATVKWDDTIDQKRTMRNTTAVFPCPYETMNDNVVNIFSASQLADIGDLSGLQIGLIDISSAVRLQHLKIGDADSNYENTNLRSLTFGNNVLLKTVDARNCSGLGDTEQQGHTQTSVDMSGCSIIEEVYYTGTKIQGLTLPNGGVLKKLHLPDTMSNLTIMNQRAITEFVLNNYSNITTLRIENSSPVIPVEDILAAISAGSRVRLIGFTTTVSTTAEVEAFYNYLDTMRGLDEQGRNVDTPQVQGTIKGLDTITGAWYAQMLARYPFITIEYQHISSTVYFYNGTTLMGTAQSVDGSDVTYTGSTPTKASDPQYTYSFSGWSKGADDNTVDADALTNVGADRNVYACYNRTIRKYTIYFVRASADGGGTLQTIPNVAYGTQISASSYTGQTPTSTRGDSTQFEFIGWSPAFAPIVGDTTYTATFRDNSSIVVKYLNKTLTEYETETNTTIRENAFYSFPALKFVKGPFTNIASSAFNNTTNSMTGLMLTNSSIPNISDINVSQYSGTDSRRGVYVPDNLFSAYMAEPTWRIYRLAPMSVYPGYETTSETWSQIKANGGSNLVLGDKKNVKLDGVDYLAVLVGKNKDELSGGGTANMTWLFMDSAGTGQMNSTATSQGGYGASELRDYIVNTLLPKFELKDSIVEVSKTSKLTGGTDYQVSNEKLWIPSVRELFGTNTYEYSGCTYSDFFINNDARRRIGYYWVRSAGTTAGRFMTVMGSGALSSNGSTATTSTRQIILGFCL